MGVVTSLNVRYHQQDRDTFCGPDTAMMILSFLRTGEPLLSQEVLRGQIAATNESNATPDGVASALELEKPQSSGVRFVPDLRGARSDANDAIVRALVDTGVPVAAEIYGGYHWTVVCGVLTDVLPAPGVPYDLQGVFVNIPTLSPTPDELGHSDDDLCGRAPHRGFLHEFMSLAGWNSSFRSNREGTFVSVTARRDVLAAPIDVMLSDAASASESLDPLQRAMDAINFYQLNTQGPLAGMLAGAVATASVPVDGDTPAFYVTMTQGGLDVGYARIAEDDGTFLGVMVTIPGQLHPILTPEEIAERLADGEFNLSGPGKFKLSGPGKFKLSGRGRRLRADDFEVGEPFWRPCREAPSPYYPLYEVRLRTEHGVQKSYATADGKLHAALTFFDAAPAYDEPCTD